MKRWGVLTIGTGLGNARFTNRNEGRTLRLTPVRSRRTSRHLTMTASTTASGR
jgi:hypothetical protein